MLEMLGRGVLKSVCQLRPGPKSFAFGELRPDRFVLGLELDSWADVHHEFRISRGTRARWASGRKQRSQPCPALHSKTSHGPDLATAFHRMPCLLARRKGRIDPATLPKASKLQLNQSYKCLYRASAGLRLESDSFRAWEMPPRGGVVAAASASQPGATLYNHSGLWQRQSGQCWASRKTTLSPGERSGGDGRRASPICWKHCIVIKRGQCLSVMAISTSVACLC